MRRCLKLMLLSIVLTATAHAQTPAQAPPPAQPLVLHASTQLVVVDVAVEDNTNHPVHNLKPEDFRVTESASPQTIRHFEEHTSQASVQQGPALPPLPAGTFTDYTPIPPNGTLNILLLDALNTPMKDQAFVRNQLQQYVKQANPGTRIAIFGLANRLILLQGFTSDPAILRNVVERKLIPRSSSLLDDPTGTGANQQQLPASAIAPPAANVGPSAIDLAANLREFQAEMGAMETELRVQYTLDAFNTLGHYLAAFPGRKNLIWFSGSFPLNILPDPTLPNPFEVAHSDEDEFRETVNLLSTAQVAVYPIDARGLMTQPIFDAANPGRNYTNHPAAFSADLKKFNESQAAEHATMNALASDTGGRAFYSTNNLAAAVTQAIDAGANYYTLSYSPTNPKQDGSYRQIRIELAAPHPGLQLSYRRGYYAANAAPTANAATPAVRAGSGDDRAAAYEQAAMSRGAPAPEDLIFKVRVLPASNTLETAAAPDNQLDPSVSPKGPFRRYDVDYVALPGELTFTQQPDGHRSAKIEFLAYVFDTEGRLLDATGKTVSINTSPNAPPTSFAKLMHSAIECRLQVSVPDRVETFIRIGVRDVPSNKFGVIEVPTSTVSHLSPPLDRATPAAPKPATPPPTTPAIPPAPGVRRPTPPQV